MLVGTYSSVLTASPLAIELDAYARRRGEGGGHRGRGKGRGGPGHGRSGIGEPRSGGRSRAGSPGRCPHRAALREEGPPGRTRGAAARPGRGGRRRRRRGERGGCGARASHHRGGVLLRTAAGGVLGTGGELGAVQLRVPSPGLQQLVVRAPLHDPAGLQPARATRIGPAGGAVVSGGRIPVAVRWARASVGASWTAAAEVLSRWAVASSSTTTRGRASSSRAIVMLPQYESLGGPPAFP